MYGGVKSQENTHDGSISATRNEELRQKLQLEYEIPIYAIKPNFMK